MAAVGPGPLRAGVRFFLPLKKGYHMQCPVCKAEPTEQKLGTDDNVIFICPQCGGYRLSTHALRDLQNNTSSRVNVDKFRDLVRQKKGTSSEYPLIDQTDMSHVLH